MEGNKQVRPRRDEMLTLDIDSLAFGGEGVARLDGLVVFVYGGLPGDRVMARVVKAKKNFVSARVESIITPSPDRVAPRCAHFGRCGGCRWQDLRYDKQIEIKEQQVKETLERIGGIADPPMEPIRGAEPWRYRNKMEFTFGIDNDESRMVIGLHKPGRFDRVVEVLNCHIQSEVAGGILDACREFFEKHPVPPYNPRTSEGVLRNLVIRTADGGRAAMACLVTTPVDVPGVESFAAILMERFPQLRGVMLFRNPADRGGSLGPEEFLLRGESVIYEKVAGLTLKVSPSSFMQTNPAQAEALYASMLEFAAPAPDETVFDLYSGAGPIALMMARRAERVYALESNPSAVADARENAELNGIDNVEFMQGEVEKTLAELSSRAAPSLVVVDPPRPGLHTKAMKSLIEARPRRIVYVSCNPATLARDAALLIEAGWRLRRVRPIDMFPHTYHIECVTEFVRE